MENPISFFCNPIPFLTIYTSFFFLFHVFNLLFYKFPSFLSHMWLDSCLHWFSILWSKLGIFGVIKLPPNPSSLAWLSVYTKEQERFHSLILLEWPWASSSKQTCIRSFKWNDKHLLSADSFSSALLVISSKGEGRRTFWQVFCSNHFSAQARHLGFKSGCKPWSKYLDPELSWGWILGLNSGDDVWGWILGTISGDELNGRALGTNLGANSGNEFKGTLEKSWRWTFVGRM